jgi:hypothetical protein
MSGFKKSFRLISALGLTFALAGALAALQIIRHPSPSGPLAGRLDWALQEAAKSSAGKGFWVGFGIRRLMGEHSQMGMNVSFTSGVPALEELIYGRRPLVESRISASEATGATAGKASDPFGTGRKERKVLREIAILMKFAAPGAIGTARAIEASGVGSATGARKPQSVSACSLVYGVSLEDLPLFWLGPAADDDSIRLLEGFYGPDASEALRASLAEAIALHRRPDLVVPFLERIINNGREPERLRADAAEFLGDQDDVRALDVLRRTIRTDASLEVRKGAVSGLTAMDLPASADVLIELALHEREADVRDEAIEGLAEKATKATVAALEQLVVADKDVEIQKRAVSALADLPEKSGLPYLIKIAKTHPLRDVRVEAIEALGDFHDPAAAKALVEIIKNAR